MIYIMMNKNKIIQIFKFVKDYRKLEFYNKQNNAYKNYQNKILKLIKKMKKITVNKLH